MLKDSIKPHKGKKKKKNHRTFKLESIQKNLILLFMEKQIQEKVGKFAKDTQRDKRRK